MFCVCSFKFQNTFLSGKIALYAVFPLRKFYTGRMFVLVRTLFSNHVDTQPVKSFKRYESYAIYIYDIKIAMLQVRETEISLRNWSGGTAHLRTVEGTLF